jgi:predicted XRE-type DNA-binding protein
MGDEMSEFKPVRFGPRSEKEAYIYAEEEFRVDVQHAIYTLMQQKRVTQKQLAARLGVSAARVSHIFSDRCNLTVRLLARIYRALGERCRVVTSRGSARVRPTLAPIQRTLSSRRSGWR